MLHHNTTVGRNHTSIYQYSNLKEQARK